MFCYVKYFFKGYVSCNSIVRPDAIPIFSGRRMLPFFGCHPESRQGRDEGSRLLVIEILRACGTQNDYIAVMLNPDCIGTGSFQDLMLRDCGSKPVMTLVKMDCGSSPQ